MTDPKPINDPSLYRKLCEPFSNAETANENLQKFFSKIEELREELRIPDVTVLCTVNMLASDGTEVTGFARMSRGDMNNVLPMLARSYGEETTVSQERLAKIMANGRKGRGA
jgi:hypothetical protein